ncbi:NADPH-dependent ferric siderophore reductase, contains FAD-binding and SIP domains [Nocardioides terrae]|uniref:NADPH-dependent ferric siderophore reductase, contains FAD-binding and SIP domains n=1 Tax=Nocardioides terrae TaxID=574651 RepID=A0A1I1D726_9ACTN|nr:siderophore-interacting protein [Nocardioides terrae]SFB70136.1 NADPH-dependent ferric siderophore reductase, contains FAD-binding and SIP domains [Nocardioides terrae]
MSVRAEQYDARVITREVLSPHLVRIVLDVPGFVSTGVPDEWVGLVVPGQFQSRYYTVRSVLPSAGSVRLTLDIVVHETGLVTEWAAREEIVGETVTITEPKGSFELPEDPRWLLLVGDLTALPAMARISETHAGLQTRILAEVPTTDELGGYLPGHPQITWLGAGEESRLASVVEGLDWPEGDGYFWMAGESAQMRAIRKHLMRDRQLPSHAYDVMGYWRASTGRQPRRVDPGPVYRAGKAAGLTDEQIWADYDQAQEAQQ